ncbi:MAG: TonB-dependent receptor [Bryobacteraceae bacterium]|nr:TonB-dependent receptor [Bryobacteraceae bacterium]
MKVLFALLLTIPAAFAQSGQITGRITDSSGAVVVAALVAASHVDTGTRYPAQSNEDGYFTISRLEPGAYRVEVRHAGFRPVVRAGIVMQVDQTARVDFALEVGGVTETVEVSGEAPLVESETSNVGQVVNNTSIVEMPLNGRNAWDLSVLAGATIYVSGGGDAGEVPVVSMAGGRTWSQSLLLDGGSVQKSGLARSQAELSPMVDAVEEFKVITNNYAAEYGRTAAGVFTAVTKSGTNQFRGNLFEFLRNDKVDARNFFANTKAPLRFNQFGGTAGGPIRKNKTHFFVALENTLVTRGLTNVLTIASAAQKRGDFSGLTNAQGRALVLYSPFTNRPDPADPTRTLRDPFPGNRIPANLIDPVAARAASYYPDPNQQGNLAGANNYNINVPVKRTQYHGTARVDHILSQKDRIYGRYVAQKNILPQASVYAEPAASGIGVGNASRNVDNLAQTLLVSWVRTVTPTLLNDLKWSGTSQTRAIQHASIGGDWPDKLGLKGVGQKAFPRFTAQGFSALGTVNSFRDQTNPYWHLSETVSWFRGAHSWKAGFEFRRNVTTDEFDTSPSGDFTFSQQGTGLQGNANSGNGFATMLLGFATNAQIVDQPKYRMHNRSIGLFLQDDWKVTPRLTLNLGVRYDVENGRTADSNMQSGFDMRKIHPVAGVPGVVTFAGVDGTPVTNWDTDRNNIAPRFGFAWRPLGNGDTVIRGGIGMFYGNPDDGGFNNTAVAGFGINTLLTSPDQNQSAVLLLRDGVRPPVFPGPADRTPSFGMNGPVDFYQRERSVGYSIQQNFGIQHQVKTTLLSAQYISNLGRKLTAGALSQNQVRPELVGKTGSIQSRRPFPQFTAVDLVSPNLGVSSYHAFLMRVERRYRNGVQVLFNYTFSKFIDNVDPLSDFGGTPGAGYQDLYNRRLDKSISPNDITHSSTFSAVYELPWGPKRRWLRSGLAGQIVGGWQLSALTSLRSGAAYGVSTLTNTCECSSAGPLRPDLLRDPALPADQRSVQRWFDIQAFAQPARFKFGTAARSVGRAPGASVANLALMKNFRSAERFRLQFRGEFFNALNHANFGIPGNQMDSANFGSIISAADARVIQVGLKLYF